MSEKVLLVDDDPNILKAYERRLRKRFTIETALCSEEGVTAATILGPFAVVVSDMKMPRENGAEFLAKMLRAAPDCVRIMLTGNADQQAAADAVNLGRVFRFLNKPCPAEELERAIEEGIAEHHRLREQRELVGKTAHGCVSMLSKLLALAEPRAFGRAERVAQLARELGEAAGREDLWELETSALLSQLGAFAAPAESGGPRAHRYRVAAELIREAPPLELVARVVELQGDEPQSDEDDERTLGCVELLRVALEYDRLQCEAGMEPAAAHAVLEEELDGLSETTLAAFADVVRREDARRLAEVDLAELAEGMRLVDDVQTTEGMMLVAHGQDVTALLLKRLAAHAGTHAIRQPIRVLLPVGCASEAGREEPVPV